MHEHEIACHWRLREHRLRLSGFKRELEDGTVQVSLTGSNWVEARHNGHHHDENPFEGRIIYRAPLSIHGEIDIPASSG